MVVLSSEKRTAISKHFVYIIIILNKVLNLPFLSPESNTYYVDNFRQIQNQRLNSFNKYQ